MKKATQTVLLTIVLLFACLYAGDYAVLRVRMARNTAYDSVNVREYYVIQEKNNRVEYVFKSAQDESCGRSIFGHAGLTPCWYLRKHPEQQVNI